MAKLRMQVIILALCLIAVLMAKYYVDKFVGQNVAGPVQSGAPAGEPGTVEMPTPVGGPVAVTP